MSESFDPYRKWLGIPPKDQPPNHYRLLGIELFDDDPDVIEGAADQRMAHVRTYQTGANSALSQKILNELSAAKLCLLDPVKRGAYDRELRTQLAKKATAVEQGVADDEVCDVVPLSELDAAAATIEQTVRSPRPAASAVKRQSSWQVPTILAAGLLLVILSVSLVWVIGKSNEPSVKANKTTDLANDGGETARRIQPNQTVKGSEASRRHASSKASDSGVETVPAAPPPVAASADREVAEEVLRRGGQVWIVANGQSHEVSDLAALPAGDWQTVDVRFLHAGADKVADLSFLTGAPRLEAIFLVDSRITSAALLPLAGSASLKVLNLEDTRLPSGALKAILPLPQLEVLLLAGCEITPADLRELGVLKKLRVLGLQGAKLGDDDMSLLNQFPELQSIHLYNVPIGDRGLKTLVECLPRLRELVISATKIGDEGLQALAALKQLALLDLASDIGVTAEGLRSLKSLQTLEWLKLDHLNVTDEALQTVGQLTRLRELLLSGNGITDTGLAHLASLPALARLEVKDTKITEKGITELKKALPQCEIVANPVADSVASTPTTPPATAASPSGTPPAAMRSEDVQQEKTSHTRAMPDAESLAAAERALKLRFKSKWAGGRDAASKLESAHALTLAAHSPDCEPAEQFALLSHAADLAASAGSYTESKRVLGLLAAHFPVRLSSLLADALTQVNRVNKQPEQKQAVVDEAIMLAGEAIDDNDYDAAERIVKLASTAAKSSSSRQHTEDIKLVAKDVALLARQYERVKDAAAALAADTRDAEASLALGKFECEFKRNWNVGLALLARGSDERLRSLAVEDRSYPDDIKKRKELADEWLAYAAQADGEAKVSYQTRGLSWLDLARPGLTADEQTAVEKQMSDIKATAAYRNRPLRWLDRLGVGFEHEDVLDCSSKPHSFALSETFDLTKPWTLSLEFEARNLRVPGLIFFIGDERGGHDPLYISLDGHENVRVSVCDATTGEECALAAALEPEKWNSVRATYDGSGRPVKLFVNGRQMATGVVPFAPRLDRPMSIWIGSDSGTGQRYDGKVRRVLLRNDRPRSPQGPYSLVGAVSEANSGGGAR